MLTLKDFIQKPKKVFSLKSTFSEALESMNIDKLSHLPVIDEGVFLGNLSLNDAETYPLDDEIVNSRSLFEVFFARENSFWFELIEIFAKNETNIIPVLSNENIFIGFYLLDDVVQFFKETPFLKENGTTIIVEKNLYQYSISEISQIFEINNSKIFGIIISEIIDQNIQIVIKATSVNINEIIQSLRRYEYNIVSEHIEDHFLSDLKDRSDYLDKYLNV